MKILALGPAGAAAALALLAACDGAAGSGGSLLPQVRAAAPADSGASFGQVEDFRLVRQDGEPVTRADLAGRPWVVASFFTRCMGPCPALTASMRELQSELAGEGVRLVSLSVDPTFDDPGVLAAYATREGADPDTWWFLTGEEPDVFQFLRHSVLQPAGDRITDPDVGEHFVTHDVRLCVIDGDGAVRGWYHHELERDLLLERVRFLLDG